MRTHETKLSKSHPDRLAARAHRRAAAGRPTADTLAAAAISHPGAEIHPRPIEPAHLAQLTERTTHDAAQ